MTEELRTDLTAFMRDVCALTQGDQVDAIARRARGLLQRLEDVTVLVAVVPDPIPAAAPEHP